MGEPFTQIDAWYSNDPQKPLQFGKLDAKPIEDYDIDGEFVLLPAHPLITFHPSLASAY